ncbi:MAG TPA: DNA-directed RNA polymerase subunit beta' [Candidatus Krumholzibacteria bacterium]|nr:DNA-directed RNA polymerase subunit beta' [Candidatus Krumholzibacteria bacterium]HPD72047.1 DNA-directed RNA polymerase subunit beta' [Candidatus Krumholzibacteria bacterium]HRY41020.1 DNA-directed RNA polymerase subunit beta' [Candidatus Krumholzibacteria bacterium]
MLGTRQREEKVSQDFKSILIQLASPDKIRDWSYGEVTKPETINYRTFKPEKDGLFCERIFGPVKDWECNCGKYKRIRFRGIVCDKCGVEVTQSKVRRERLGHIELAVPIAHIWFFKGLPSRIGQLLDIRVKDLERVLYYESSVVIDPGNTEFKVGDIVSDDEWWELKDEHPEWDCKMEMGAEAIRKLLAGLDLEEMDRELRAQIKTESSIQRKKSLLKRLKVVDAFRQSNNQPQWMILDCLPVLPPDLRPLVPLDGGRFATSDLNDLYRRVINRNNRLKKLIEIKAPGVILRNEKRMLQEAVDALFDNGRRSRAVKGQGNRPLKSLSDMIKGKKGRFRQNLLGKRVDYSGRSVIVVGPELRLYQCGLPKSMALELFKPFIIRKLEEKGYVQTVKSAKKLVEKESPEVWDILEEIIQDHPVLLNRAPTLHRLGIQAFEPVLIEGKAIRIHPLVCTAFNADFDGDQMAVHVPLGYEAQLEARLLMLSPLNILSPASGEPIATPSQDMVLGCYYLTLDRPGDRGEGKAFASPEDALAAFEAGLVSKHARIRVRFPEHGRIETTPGRILFNRILPEELGYVNQPLGKKQLAKIVAEVHHRLGVTKCMNFLDQLKELGFYHATEGGISIGIDDIIIPPEKEAIIAEAQAVVTGIVDQHRKGIITNRERYNKVIDKWTQVTNEVRDRMFDHLATYDSGFNPVYMMNASGARGSADQIKQLAGMRGLMAKPQKKITGGIGEIIEQPIIANFREGLTMLEYFISTHGARKGLADTALKTADAGYLTRRLVDVAQDIVISEHDCGTLRGIEMTALKEGEKTIETLAERIVGRAAAEDVYDPNDELIVEAGELITKDVAHNIEEMGLQSVITRSVLTCESRRGVCALCYGFNLAEDKLVDIGEPVGVMAAQSIGEPGTQLTLRTFHIGGTASRIVEQNIKTAAAPGKIVFNDEVKLVKNDQGDVVSIGRRGEINLVLENGRTRSQMIVPYGARVLVKNNQKVAASDPIFEWDPFADFVLSEKSGVVQYVDIIPGVSLSETVDEKTRRKQPMIMEPTEKNVHPSIQILSAKTGRPLAEYIIPTGAMLLVEDGEEVGPGRHLVKIPREVAQSGDITGGLPRVAELFEARRPRDTATVTEIDGTVQFRGTTRGMRKVVVQADSGAEKEYLIPHGRHVRTYDGERVLAGDRLTEGPINPMDILSIKGVGAVQTYLVNAIQEVYRLQGVRINDKHIEIIVSRMLQKVQILTPGDTPFLEGDQVPKKGVEEANRETQRQNVMLREKGEPELEPATFEPLLLGITKASLTTDSFISAASFQETTRVLTEAATRSKRDELHSLKENVIMGHLISAGTGLTRYKNLAVEDPEDEDDAILEAVEQLRALAVTQEAMGDQEAEMAAE